MKPLHVKIAVEKQDWVTGKEYGVICDKIKSALKQALPCIKVHACEVCHKKFKGSMDFTFSLEYQNAAWKDNVSHSDPDDHSRPA